jgi:hypothetical protein
MMRVTKEMLERRVNLLNDMAGQSREPYAGRDESGNLIVNAGTYVINYDYGQPRLERMSQGGGCESIGPRLPKGQFADVLNAYISGFEAGQRNA